MRTVRARAVAGGRILLLTQFKQFGVRSRNARGEFGTMAGEPVSLVEPFRALREGIMAARRTRVDRATS